MLHKRGRPFTASVYLGKLPDIQADKDGELVNPLDRHIWQTLISQAEVIEGSPDTQYKKDGVPVLVHIPDDCDYWVDGKRLLIAHEKQICQKCHGFSEGETCQKCERAG